MINKSNKMLKKVNKTLKLSQNLTYLELKNRSLSILVNK